ncbi:MAG: Rrf2 family transcriptional regulator [Candidatus Electryonea clarkiae]|nr:Rrf2 family transcriptional regulator [Candidatus Electryonea clarkiae]MDP8285156.1 Rrf2 family transcriptional regulator [Candidatus Electryonea clarkiae]
MITTTSEYAIRAVGYLTNSEDDVRIGSDEIAEATHVPKRFLLKILNTLKNQGILRTSRGIGGGFSLAKDPKKLTLFDVVSVFEDISRFSHCLSGDQNCSSENPCPLHKKWNAILEKMEDLLKGTTFSHYREYKKLHEKS